MFAECGRVVSAQLEVQKGGLNNGKKRAFVEFERYDGAERAVAEFHGAEVNHERINVRAYKSEGPHDQARGSSGGGQIVVVKAGAAGGSGGGGGSDQVRIKGAPIDARGGSPSPRAHSHSSAPPLFFSLSLPPSLCARSGQPAAAGDGQ